MPYVPQQQTAPGERPLVPPQFEGLFQEPAYANGVVYGEDEEEE